MKAHIAILLLTTVLFFSSCGEKSTYALIQTDFGDMKVKLYNSTPLHRDNFIKLVNEGFYNDLLFHRVINNFMIQGGDPNSKYAPAHIQLGGGGPGYKIPAEIGAPHLKGRLAAARQSGPGNIEKKSSGSQFYIVQGTPQTLSALQHNEKRKKIKYNDEQIKLYQEIGGRPDLDGDYTVFGEVVEGIEVIDKIAAVETATADRPVEEVKMTIKIL